MPSSRHRSSWQICFRSHSINMFPTIMAFINGFFFGIFCVIVFVPVIVWKSSERTKTSVLAMCGLSPFTHKCSSLQHETTSKSQRSDSRSPRTVPVDCGSHSVSNRPSSVSSEMQQVVQLGFPPSALSSSNAPRDRENTAISTMSAKKTNKQKRLEAIATAKALMQSDKEKVECNRRRRGLTPLA